MARHCPSKRLQGANPDVPDEDHCQGMGRAYGARTGRPGSQRRCT
ncbi:hypothetical protein [Lysobacter gummosus]